MNLKITRRATALSILAFLLSATAVFADTVPTDGDVTIPGNQASIDLGARGPGETITREVNFSLVCQGTSHPADGATITIQPNAISQPQDGTIASTSTTIGPIPASWPDNPASCPSPAPVLAANGPVTVTLKTPTLPGIDYQFTIIYARVGASGFSGTTAINFTVDVVVNTPPTLTLPDPISVEATAASGAAVNFAVSAADAQDDPDPTPTCTPASGATFPLGTTTVSCTVTDTGGLTALGAFPVTVRDTTAPDLTLPGSMTVEATDAAGAVATFYAGATDSVDPAPAVDCSPPSGSTFHLGTTTVACTATDGSGNQSSGTFDVTVSDTTAPTLVLPDAVIVESAGPGGTEALYAATATDAVDPAPVVDCAPASGSTFPNGTTTVACTATDATGNQSTGSFDVTVADSTGPVLTGVPADIAVTTNNPAGTAVPYDPPTAHDGAGGEVGVDCSPASGWTFPIGATTVTCTATDGAGNAASAGFTVSVSLDDEPQEEPGPDYDVEWGEPISGGTLSANQSRTVPLKIRLAIDGVEKTTGTAALSVTRCGDTALLLTVPLAFNGGRWQAHLDTTTLPLGCYTATLLIDGNAAGSFTLDLRGADPASAPKPKDGKPTRK
jgi:hypothetical protein